MHELALSRAALPAPVTCLGRELKPYSLGHELWLIRESNAVLRGSVEGLHGAVLICSHTWDELKELRSWRWQSLDLKLWHWRTRKIDPRAELLKFIEYRNNGLLEFAPSEIIRPDRETSGRTLGAPFILRLQQWLMTHFRITESQAWDYPVGLAKMRWATHWEAEGCFEIKNAAEAEFDEFVAETRRLKEKS